MGWTVGVVVGVAAVVLAYVVGRRYGKLKTLTAENRARAATSGEREQRRRADLLELQIEAMEAHRASVELEDSAALRQALNRLWQSADNALNLATTVTREESAAGATQRGVRIMGRSPTPAGYLAEDLRSLTREIQSAAGDNSAPFAGYSAAGMRRELQYGAFRLERAIATYRTATDAPADIR